MWVALLMIAVVPNTIQVDANIYKSMHLTWGVQHASILGEDLHLVLDKTSGETFMLNMHEFRFQLTRNFWREIFCIQQLGIVEKSFIVYCILNKLQLNYNMSITIIYVHIPLYTRFVIKLNIMQTDVK